MPDEKTNLKAAVFNQSFLSLIVNFAIFVLKRGGDNKYDNEKRLFSQIGETLKKRYFATELKNIFSDNSYGSVVRIFLK